MHGTLHLLGYDHIDEADAERVAEAGVTRAYVRTRVVGAERIPARGPYIICFNHPSWLDPIFFAAYWPDRTVSTVTTLGEALRLGKAEMWSQAIPSTPILNARRYNLMGDPALRLAQPVSNLEFSATSDDTLRTGRLHRVDVDLTAAGLEPGADAAYELWAQESDLAAPYVTSGGTVQYWQRLGRPVFRGNGPIVGGQAVASFIAPLSLRTGEGGRLRCLVSDDQSASVAVAAVPVVQTSADAGGDVFGHQTSDRRAQQAQQRHRDEADGAKDEVLKSLAAGRIRAQT